MKTCPHCDTGFPDSHTTCPTHGVLLNEIRDLKPGMVIHKTYRIVRKLGQGGMGTVYLADHIHMGEPRALKFLSPELSRDQISPAAFCARRAHCARCVPQRCGCGDLEAAEDDSLFFSMEFVDGPDLRGFLDKRPGHFPSSWRWTSRAASPKGLGAAHAQGMVHRDIKPENILMAARGMATGFPRSPTSALWPPRKQQQHLHSTGGTLLTMAYAAPEQWRGTPAQNSTAAPTSTRWAACSSRCLHRPTSSRPKTTRAGREQHKNVAPRPPSSVSPHLATWKGPTALSSFSCWRKTQASARKTLLKFFPSWMRLPITSPQPFV